MKENIKLRENLRRKRNIFQYVYVYPDVYCNSERYGFYLKSEFQIKLKKSRKTKQTSQHLGNDPSVYKYREDFLTLNKNQ